MRNSDAKKREKRQSEGSYRRVGQEPGQNAVFSHLIIKPRLSMHLDVFQSKMFQKLQNWGTKDQEPGTGPG